MEHDPIEDEDDPVILELPVFACNDLLLQSNTSLSLFHSPLRPPWRPYEYGKTMRMKPKAMKLEVGA